MLGLGDLRQTRVYQEALEEGKLEGRLEGKLESVPRLLALGLSLEQIAEALALDVGEVRRAAQQSSN
jgi:predicted transposase/invertase (TIGR01784 family)